MWEGGNEGCNVGDVGPHVTRLLEESLVDVDHLLDALPPPLLLLLDLLEHLPVVPLEHEPPDPLLRRQLLLVGPVLRDQDPLRRVDVHDEALGLAAATLPPPRLDVLGRHAVQHGRVELDLEDVVRLLRLARRLLVERRRRRARAGAPLADRVEQRVPLLLLFFLRRRAVGEDDRRLLRLDVREQVVVLGDFVDVRRRRREEAHLERWERLRADPALADERDEQP